MTMENARLAVSMSKRDGAVRDKCMTPSENRNREWLPVSPIAVDHGRRGGTIEAFEVKPTKRGPYKEAAN